MHALSQNHKVARCYCLHPGSRPQTHQVSLQGSYFVMISKLPLELIAHASAIENCQAADIMSGIRAFWQSSTNHAISKYWQKHVPTHDGDK